MQDFRSFVLLNAFAISRWTSLLKASTSSQSKEVAANPTPQILEKIASGFSKTLNPKP